MAINERDFYASHGFDFDYKNMLEEYIKGVIKQAKIEVLTELLLEIEEMQSRENWCDYATDSCISRYNVEDLIQQKINVQKEV